MGMEAPPLKNPSETSYLNLRPPVILRHRPAWNPYSSFTLHEANHFRSRNRTFLTFLSSYGPGGVSLRELIMLATLSELGRESKNHWLADGEVGTFEGAIPDPVFTRQDWVFRNFLRSGIVDRSAIESFQKLLESLNFIDVRYPEGTQSDEASQYWHTDERIWIIRGSESSEPSAPIDDSSVLLWLLDMLIGMPDKDVFAVAQRQREVYYYHAHLLIRRVICSRGILESNGVLLKQTVFVILQVLTHRYQNGDSLLLEFVQENFVRSSNPRMNLMLLWAELKEKAFRKDYHGLCAMRDHALYLVDSIDVHSQAAPGLKGFLGFFLVDLMKSAKALHFEDIVVDAVKAGTKWADSAESTGKSMQKTALCEMLATFDSHARNEIIHKKYYLFYGYHLSRAGFLEQGDQFLARGLESRDSLPLWSYEMERVSNALRLGHQNEAAQMLKSIRALALYYRDKDYSNFWKYSGECAETFVLLYLYEADYSASAGRLDDACAKLKSGISITSSVYDAYIRILRITLEMRLLEILMRQGSLEEALPVALNLASEILDERTSSTLAPDVVYGIAQQLIDLSNTLLSAGNAAASMALLKSITDIGSLLPGELSEELKPYVEQRMTKARHSSRTTELSGQDPNPSTLDTGIEDTKSLAQNDPSHDPTIPSAKETTFHNPYNDPEARYIIDRVEKANTTMEDIDLRPEGHSRGPGSIFQVSARPTALMSTSLDPPSSSKTWRTGIEDRITNVQTDSGYQPTVSKRIETTPLTKGFQALVYHFTKSTVNLKPTSGLGQDVPAEYYLNLIKSRWILERLKESTYFVTLDPESLEIKYLRVLEDQVRDQLVRFLQGDLHPPSLDILSQLPDNSYSISVDADSRRSPAAQTELRPFEERIIELALQKSSRVPTKIPDSSPQ